MARLIWSRSALLDLEQVCDYIARYSLNSAKKFSNEVQTRVLQLEKFPLMGKEFRSRNGLPLRKLVIKNYLLFYQVENETVEIVAFYHAKRDIPI